MYKHNERLSVYEAIRLQLNMQYDHGKSIRSQSLLFTFFHYQRDEKVN